jgi:hypothetical protein
MMLESGRIRLVRPSAVVITHKKWMYMYQLTSFKSRVTLLAHTIFKNSKKAVYRALFLIRDYNTKSQKSKNLPGKPKIYKVPHT